MDRPVSAPLPRVAVIVAARNEESLIRNLLAALTAQTYPHDRMEILLANDRSTDATGVILERWAEHFDHARVLHITETLPGLFGKANALAQLCRLTDAPLLLFTDADCIPGPHWVRGMVDNLLAHAPDPEQQAHIVTGFTQAYGNAPFAQLQGVDWTVAMGVIHALSVFRIPVTAAGNNMGCTAAAYRLAGGFEATAGSVTEDYALFQAILKAGGSFSQLADRATLLKTYPQPDWAHWMRQRKRWFSGGLKLPWFRQVPFWQQALFYPVLVPLGLLFGWQTALALALVKILGQTLLFGGYLIRLGRPALLAWLLPFEVWSVWGCWALIYAYFTDPSIEWKGTRYVAGKGAAHSPA